MATFPKRIEQNAEANRRLAASFQQTYLDIISTLSSQTEFGAARRSVVLGQIEAQLNALGVEADAWIRENVPAQYQVGMTHAVEQLQHIGADIKVGATMTQINADAVAAIMSETSSAFGTALTNVNRSAAKVFDAATRAAINQQLAEGITAGSTRLEIGKQVAQIIAEQGVPALVDRGGKRWELGNYADMLTRTKGAESRNTGLSHTMQQNGYDLVQVSAHGATDVCGDWEGEILSLSGDSDEYPSMDDAQAAGLFHPNCEHAVNAIHLELARQTDAYNTESGDYETGAGMDE
jgi:hypothetical protein